MAEQVSDMLQGALKSFTGRNVEMAGEHCLARSGSRPSIRTDLRELMANVVSDPRKHRSGKQPDVGCPQPGTNRRPGRQYLRTGILP